MNEQLQAELTKIITSINNRAETAWGFISEQTPDIIQQLLLWHGVKSGVFCLFGIIGSVLSIMGVCKLYKWALPKVKEDCETAWFIPIILPIILFFIALIEGINITWLQIWIAPKVWLLEYVSNMIK